MFRIAGVSIEISENGTEEIVNVPVSPGKYSYNFHPFAAKL